MSLPFLFVAEYDNAEIYYQTPADVSHQNPMKSAFYDIRQSARIPEERLVRFGLVRMRQFPLLVVAVDLRSGEFTINQRIVPIPSIAPRKREGVPLRLIYERRNELELNSGTHKVTFRIGWAYDEEWLALDLQAEPEKVELHGSHERTRKAELHPALVG